MSTVTPIVSSAPANSEAKRTFYVLVRTDISLAQQVVQAVHAAAEAARDYYNPEHGIASAIVLEVSDRAALLRAQALLHSKGLRTKLFFEPDFDMGESALATEPLVDAQRKHLRQWPLWSAAGTSVRAALREAA